MHFGGFYAMAFQRRLSDHQMIAARWEYEVTPISERNLAARYGLSRSAIHDWIIKQGWTRAEVLRCYEGEEGQRQFQRDVRAAIKAAEDKKIIQDLERSLALSPVGQTTKVTKAATPGRVGLTDVEDTGDVSSNQPQSSQNAPSAGPAGQRRAGDHDGHVVRFPSAYVPPSSQNTNPAGPLPSRSRTEPAATRMHLAARREELALQQIQQLEQHDEVLAEYQHLLRVYMNPGQFVDVAGLDPEQATTKREAIRRQAGRVVLPTERDTFAGAIGTLSRALTASLAAKRAVAGLMPQRMSQGEPQRDADEHRPVSDPSTLDVASLRTVHAAINLLRGDVQRHSEPPKPPPPDGLDDLMVKGDESLSGA